MTWQIAYSSRARRELRSIDPSMARRVFEALDRLATMEYGDVQRVRRKARRWRLRVGDWRVFFTYEPLEHTIRILSVRHRREAYRE